MESGLTSDPGERPKVRCLINVFVACLIGCADNPTLGGCDLVSASKGLLEDTSIDCGSMPASGGAPEERFRRMREIEKCASDGLAQGRPFVARIAHQGRHLAQEEDQWLFDRDRRLRLLRYYNDIETGGCSGPGCPSRVTMSECLKWSGGFAIDGSHCLEPSAEIVLCQRSRAK